MPTNEADAAAAGSWVIGDLPVSRGFGTKRLAGAGPFDLGDAADRECVVELLRHAVELGVNHLDTAAFYPTYPAPDGEATAFTMLGCATWQPARCG